MNRELFMGRAREAIRKMKPHTEFVVKELFEGFEWNELGRGEKLSFGRNFKNAVAAGAIAGVEFCGKRANNSAYYRKMC